MTIVKIKILTLFTSDKFAQANKKEGAWVWRFLFKLSLLPLFDLANLR